MLPKSAVATSAPPADGSQAPRSSLRDGRYVLVGQLGAGSQGTTWDAVDRRDGKPVAIKRFDVRGAGSWKDVELAEREARVVEGLDHPMLPRYVEHFEEAGALYLVMEKIEGTPLSKLGRAMSDEEVMRLLRDADKALAYLHGRSPPVVHRDLKPSNVIRRPDGSFAFVDFGAVRDRLRPEGGSTVVGTFGYMAPEQFQGRAGPGSDVYAMGATAIAMLTGEEPERLPHRGLAIDVDAALGGRSWAGLRDVLQRMLEVNPDERPTRIGALLDGGTAPAVVGSDRSLERALRDDIERKVRRHVERAARRVRRSGRRRGPPWFLWLFLILGLVVAQLAVTLMLRVAVPVLLVVLSLVFGRRLRDAARSVSRAGGRAHGAMNDAMKHLGGLGGVAPASSEADPRARVADDEPRRVRVDAPDGQEGEEAEQDEGARERTRGR